MLVQIAKSVSSTASTVGVVLPRTSPLPAVSCVFVVCAVLDPLIIFAKSQWFISVRTSKSFGQPVNFVMFIISLSENEILLAGEFAVEYGAL